VARHALAVTVGDREGALAAKLEAHLPAVATHFAGIAVSAMTVTHADIMAVLDAVGAVVSVREPSTNLIGKHRREAVASALHSFDAQRVAYFDLDHIVRWVENDPDELDRALREASEWDCTILGRGPRSFDALPARLAATETIVNRIYGLITGRTWDLMMAARSLSRAAATAIVDGCDVDTIGNDVAWPLFAEARGFSVGHLEAEGLTYLTNIDYAKDVEDARDADPRAWATRVRLAAQHVDAMVP
jgi:hypothetical protein